jgi:peptide deformylase
LSELKVVTYPHPALRHVSKPVRRVDRKLKEIVARMFELMYEHQGVGLAANQVALPLQVFVVNETGSRDTGEGLVFLNPVVQMPKGHSEAEEGCLSIPGVYGTVIRPARVHVTAWDLSGNPFDRVVEGTLARIIQHEYDHLQGILFPDRMSEAARHTIEDDLQTFERKFERALAQENGVSLEAIQKELAELEAEYG